MLPASYAYLFALTPAIGLALALPSPRWWPLEGHALWRFISWSQFVHTIAIVIVSIPFACALRVLAPRKGVRIALVITLLPMLWLALPVYVMYGGHAALRMQLIQAFDQLKLVAILPLLVGALSFGARPRA